MIQLDVSVALVVRSVGDFDPKYVFYGVFECDFSKSFLECVAPLVPEVGILLRFLFFCI